MTEITTLEQLNDFRSRVLRREELSDAEIASAIAWLRQNRVTAKPARKMKTEKSEKKATEKVDLGELDLL